MDKILNYIFIGCILSFLLDYFTMKYQNHIAWKDVPDWGWGSRIIFILFWPVGVVFFLYSLINSFTR